MALPTGLSSCGKDRSRLIFRPNVVSVQAAIVTVI